MMMKSVVEDLRSLLLPLRLKTESGNELAGLGEVVRELDSWLESKDGEDEGAEEEDEFSEPVINVGIRIGTKFQDEDGSIERTEFEIRVSFEGVVLDQLHYTYTREIGGDWATKDLANLSWDGRVKGDPDMWISEVERLISSGSWYWGVSRDHLG
jgi:hypothetical protein